MSSLSTFDLVVIGSGAAGGVAAQLAAAQGKKVALIEADVPGGEDANYGAIPLQAVLAAGYAYQSARAAKRYGIKSSTVAYNYPSIKAWKEKVINSTGVRDSAKVYRHEGITYVPGFATFTDKKTVQVGEHHYTASRFLIATGAHYAMPEANGLDTIGFITPRQLLELKAPPKSVAVLGATPEAVEIAELMAAFGSKTAIIAREDHLLPTEDHDVSTLITNALAERGIDVHVGAQILQCSKVPRAKKELKLLQAGQESTVTADEVIVAVGRRPNLNLGLENAKVKYSESGIAVNEELQTNNHHIYAAGAVTGLAEFTHIATYQARIAAHNMFHGGKFAADYSKVPRAIYTWPEVASVGYNEQQLIAAKQRFRVAKVPISVTGRSTVTGEDVGFVKVIIRPEGQILGASIVAPRASEMIHEFALAMHSNLLVSDIAHTVHAFGAWSDAVRIACSQLL